MHAVPGPQVTLPAASSSHKAQKLTGRDVGRGGGAPFSLPTQGCGRAGTEGSHTEAVLSGRSGDRAPTSTEIVSPVEEQPLGTRRGEIFIQKDYCQVGRGAPGTRRPASGSEPNRSRALSRRARGEAERPVWRASRTKGAARSVRKSDPLPSAGPERSGRGTGSPLQHSLGCGDRVEGPWEA